MGGHKRIETDEEKKARLIQYKKDWLAKHPGYQKTWYDRHKEPSKKKQTRSKEEKIQAKKDRYARLVKTVLEHYGNKCGCCGETEPMFLTLDHINNDGYLTTYITKSGHRGRRTNYETIVRNNFPEGYQILCWNCNSGRARNKGTCPHKMKKQQTT